MSRPTICLYVTGTPSDAARRRFGTFEGWFQRLFAHHDVRVQVAHAAGGRLPDLADLDGVVVTGSAASLTEPEPWMDPAMELIRRAHQARTPLLGVCFGHQLIAAALSCAGPGAVVRNPAGWQLAARPVDLTDAGQGDPLFAGVPARFHALFSHQDIVDPAAAPAAIEPLAGNAKAALAAVAVGDHIRGVQFHPEFTAEITRFYIELRRDTLTREAEAHGAPADHPDALLAALRPAPHAEQVVHNFIDHFVGRPTH